MLFSERLLIYLIESGAFAFIVRVGFAQSGSGLLSKKRSGETDGDGSYMQKSINMTGIMMDLL